MGFSGSALDGESSAFSPPCPRMFLLILNPTRRHFEEADFLAKKMTSACLVWSLFFFFTFLKHFSPSSACWVRGTNGASHLWPWHHRQAASVVPIPQFWGIFAGFNLQILFLTCKFQIFPCKPPPCRWQEDPGAKPHLAPSFWHSTTCKTHVPNEIRGERAQTKSQRCLRCFLEGVFAGVSLIDSSAFLLL